MEVTPGMTEEFYVGQRVAIRGGGTVAPGQVVAIDAEGITVERQRPPDEIGPLTKGARVRSRWHPDGDALGRAGDVLCAWIEPWAEEHAAMLAARGAEGSSPHGEEHRERGAGDRPRAPAAPPAAPAGSLLTLILRGSRSLALRGFTRRFGRDLTEPGRG